MFSKTINVLSGGREGCGLGLLLDNTQFIVYTAFKGIIERENVENVVVKEVRSDNKKDMVGSIAAGALLGFATGGIGAIAGATGGNYQNVLFTMESPLLGNLLCEAKHDVYKRILGSCKSFS